MIIEIFYYKTDTTLLMHSSSDDESIAEKPTRLSTTINSPPSLPLNEENAATSDDPTTVSMPTSLNENKILQAGLPAEIANDKQLQKYLHKRFSLFSLYDSGIKLDKGTLNSMV